VKDIDRCCEGIGPIASHGVPLAARSVEFHSVYSFERTNSKTSRGRRETSMAEEKWESGRAREMDRERDGEREREEEREKERERERERPMVSRLIDRRFQANATFHSIQFRVHEKNQSRITD